MKAIDLRPCPFCGKVPVLVGEEMRDFYDGVWAEKSRQVYGVQPRCHPACLLGNAWMRAYGVVAVCHYTSPEAAATAWNTRNADSSYAHFYEVMKAERDKALARLCDWCGVCPSNERDALDCEIAGLDNLETSPDWATTREDRPTHDENGQLLYYPSETTRDAQR